MPDNREEELLKKLRGRLAYTSGVEPYVIFNDQQFLEVLRVRPQTVEELSNIKGFPIEGKRIERWGQAIVDIFTKKDKIADFEISKDSEGEVIAKTVLRPMNIFG